MIRLWGIDTSVLRGADIIDHLIADGYAESGHETLTLERNISNLPGARLL